MSYRLWGLTSEINPPREVSWEEVQNSTDQSRDNLGRFSREGSEFGGFGSRTVPDVTRDTPVRNPLGDRESEYILKAMTDSGRYKLDSIEDVTDVDTRSLKAWQGIVYKTDSLRPLGDDAQPIRAVKHKGKTIVMDGNHRAVMAWAEGRPTIKAHVLDLDDQKNQKYLKKAHRVVNSSAQETGWEPISSDLVVNLHVAAGVETLTANLSGKVRRAFEGGRHYLVAPLTMIVPGVLNGSKGSLYYPESEVADRPSKWDGTPMVLYHPYDPLSNRPVSVEFPGVRERSEVGRVKNSRIRQGRLQAEGWFDVERTKRLDSQLQRNGKPPILPRLERGEPVELSTGLYTENEPARVGACDGKGRPYDYIARNYQPDHLAILPDQVGACSVRDGCGVLVNQELTANSCRCGGSCERCLTKPSLVDNPFVSEKQRRFLWANEPEIAHAWAHGEHTSEDDHRMPGKTGKDVKGPLAAEERRAQRRRKKAPVANSEGCWILIENEEGWVTLDGGQHVYIDAAGNFKPGGPSGSKVETSSSEPSEKPSAHSAEREESKPAAQSEPDGSAPIIDLHVYHGGLDTEGKHVTYYTTRPAVAQSYVEMSEDRYGVGKAAIHEGHISIRNPAPASVIESAARKAGIDNEYNTPASVFDTELHGDVEVGKLIRILKEKGYDGAVLDDIGYGSAEEHGGEFKAYITFTGASKTAPNKPAKTAATVQSLPKTKAASGETRELKQLRTDIKELEEADRRGFLSDRRALESRRTRLRELIGNNDSRRRSTNDRRWSEIENATSMTVIGGSSARVGDQDQESGIPPRMRLAATNDIPRCPERGVFQSKVGYDRGAVGHSARKGHGYWRGIWQDVTDRTPAKLLKTMSMNEDDGLQGDIPSGESCPGCGIRLERGDNGRCNRCGRRRLGG